MNHQEIAEILDQAARYARPISQLATDCQIDLDAAYQIQNLCVSKRLERGEYVTGYKLGITNRAKMQELGVHDLIWGVLTNSMEILNQEKVEVIRWIQPRAETEIAFRISKDIEESVGLKEITNYIDKMAPAIEIVDSRYENFKFSLEDVVADNCSASAYVVGDWINLEENINDLQIHLKVNRETLAEGKTNAILSNPLQSVVELSRLASKAGTVIKKGQIVLAGAATTSINFSSNQLIEAQIEKLGKVSFKTN
ncbi:2-keto-4-pentenoate hydratase [Mesonia aestuariivivens]|uniref:Fumarylacetoacetate hydrolase family protein n=1 Tax=Mesonia aestuariivivens TaxID=2796128 RepID=A0ABS6VZ91_9FLAO|nr:fumarylacetoacetate hydrolase family protein [Mesonia aestuariivivens]MBW2960909.1 fumarylacetoacetate hydrolase family protein [Mesonia aestuariivivens]